MLHSFLALSTFAALAAAFALPLEERQEQACSSLHLMVAGGCALPCTSDSLGLLSTTVSNITTAIPNTDLYLVPYDGNPFQAAVSTPLMVQAANEYAAACPNTPIVFVGYSLGGIIVTNTLCGGISYNPNVIASITYGEETRVYPESYDRGSCEQSAPKYPRGNTAACEPFAPIMQSYCDYGDPQCCTGGFIPAQHFEYAAKYDLAALAFVESQYEAFTNTNLNQTSSSLPTTTVTTSIVQPTSYQPATTSTGLTTTTVTTSIVQPTSYQPATTSTGLATTYTSLRYSNSSMVSSTSSSATVPVGGESTVPVGGESTGISTATSAVTSGPLLTHYSTTETVIGGTASTITVLVPVATTTTVIPTFSPTGITTPSIPTTGSLTSTLIPLTGVVYPSSIPSSYQYLTSSTVQPDAIGATTTAAAPSVTDSTPPASSSTGLTPFTGSASSLANSAALMISCVFFAWRLLA